MPDLNADGYPPSTNRFGAYLTVGPFGGYLSPAFGDGDDDTDWYVSPSEDTPDTSGSGYEGAETSTDLPSSDAADEAEDAAVEAHWYDDVNWTSVLNTAIQNGPAAIKAARSIGVIDDKQYAAAMAKIGQPLPSGSPGTPPKKAGTRIPGWLIGAGIAAAAAVAVAAMKR